MTLGEKQILRYNFIVEKAKIATGDAAKTTNFYANATKALKDFVTETATIMSLEAIPTFEKLFKALRKATGGLQKLNDEFGIFKPIVIGISAALGLFSAALLLRFAPFILKLNLFTAAFIALGFAIEDVITFFKRGESAIGSFFDAFRGPGTQERVLVALIEDGELLREKFILFGDAVKFFFQKAIPDALDFTLKKIDLFIEKLKEIPVLGTVIKAFSGIVRLPGEESFPGQFEGTPREIRKDLNPNLRVGESFPGEFSRNITTSNNNASINVTVNAQTNASAEDIANTVNQKLERFVSEAFDGTVKFAE